MQRILIASLGAMIVLSGSGVEADGTDPKYKDNPHIQTLALGASKASSWIYTHDHPGSRHYADLKNEALLKEELELVRERCAKAAAEALRTGIPASALVDFDDNDAPVKAPLPLGQIDAKVCQPAIKLLQGGGKGGSSSSGKGRDRGNGKDKGKDKGGRRR